MSEAENNQELNALYPQILVKELIEKTKGGAIVWHKPNGTRFESDWDVNSRFYKAFLIYLKGTYRLDVFRNGRNVYSVDATNVPDVTVLYQILDIYASQDEYGPAILAVQKQIDAQSIFTAEVSGGIVVGGRAQFMSRDIARGGVDIAGVSTVVNYFPGHGGAVLGGAATEQHLSLRIGGVKVGGSAIAGVTEGGTLKQTPLLYPSSDYEYQQSNVSIVVFNGGTPTSVPPEEMWDCLDESGPGILALKCEALPGNATLRFRMDDVPGDFVSAVELLFEMQVLGNQATYYDFRFRVEDTSGNILVNWVTPDYGLGVGSNYKYSKQVWPIAVTDETSWNNAILVLNFDYNFVCPTHWSLVIARMWLLYV